MPPFCTLIAGAPPSASEGNQPMSAVKIVCYDAVIAA